ncbi:MAG: hypothetical protein ACJA0X_001081 [Cyclobacteriaceae bacterium]
MAETKAGAIKEYNQLGVMSGSFNANLDKFDQEKPIWFIAKEA